MSTPATAHPAWTVDLGRVTEFRPANKAAGDRAGFDVRFKLHGNAVVRWGFKKTVFGLSAGKKTEERLEDGNLNPYHPQVGPDGCIVDMGEKDPAKNGNRTVGWELTTTPSMFFHTSNMNTPVPQTVAQKEDGTLNDGYVALSEKQVADIFIDSAQKALAANFDTVFPPSAVPIRALPSRDYETVLAFIKERTVFTKPPK